MDEFIPDNVSEKDVTEEANYRASKCGYCTREGNPMFRTKIMIHPPSKKYEENYARIFGHE